MFEVLYQFKFFGVFNNFEEYKAVLRPHPPKKEEKKSMDCYLRKSDPSFTAVYQRWRK